MSNKLMSSGQLLSSLNRKIDRSHHKKPQFIQDQQKVVDNNVDNEKQLNLPHQNKSIKEKQLKQQKIQQKIKESNVIKQNITKKNPILQEKAISVQKEYYQGQKQRQNEQNKTVRSNISKAFQIKQNKSTFKSKFINNDLSIEEEQIGESLHDILAMQIGKLVSQPLAQVIQNVMKEKQDNIYITFTKDELYYLQNLLQQQKKKPSSFIPDIESLLSRREQKTMDKLQTGQLYIDRQKAISSKSQIQELTKLDIARMLKIKQGTIRSKIDLLNDKMIEIEALQNKPKQISPSNSLIKLQQEKLEEITDPNNFSLNSQKTKIANDYVKHLQQQKLILLKNMRQRQQKRSQMQKQRQIELKQAQQMRNAVKKQQIQQKLKQYKKRKEQQQSLHKQKQKKVEQFLKQYRKSLPLYKKKQNQFVEVYQKKKNKEFQEKLKAIKETHRSMSFNQIKQHQHKYLERKSLEQSKKQQDIKMIMKARKASESGREYFKGFYHEKVKILDQEQRLKFYSLRESSKIKVQRITEFQQKIRRYHKPKVDPKKKQDLQRIIELDDLKKKKVKKIFKQVQDENGQTRIQAHYQQIPQIDHYRQGNKYMAIAKSLAKKKKPQQMSRYSQQPHFDMQQIEKIQNGEQSKRKKSQLSQHSSPIFSQQKDIWRLRGKQLNQMTDEIDTQNFHQIKKNLQLMDDKAKMRQALLKHKQSDAQEIMEQKAMLDEFYLESIKNKIKLLNQ